MIGNYFLVQSDKRSAEYIIHQTNEFLIEKKKAILDLTQEQFEVQRKSVHTRLAQKDLNLNDQSSRFWSDITSHKYVFDRQAKSLQVLNSLTLKELRDHY